jgi:hypothetical protein
MIVKETALTPSEGLWEASLEKMNKTNQNVAKSSLV